MTNETNETKQETPKKILNKNNQKVLEIVEKIKISTIPELTRNGELIKLTVNYNNPLRELLKLATINEKQDLQIKKGYDEYERVKYITEERYKVKRIIFSNLSNSYKEHVFLKKLIDKGSYKFNFTNLNDRDEFISHFKTAITRIIKNIVSVQLEQTITFNLNLLEN